MTVVLPAVRAAAVVAPIIDRVRLGLMRTVLASGFPAAVREAGLGEHAALALGYVRNAYPDRPFTRSNLAAVFTYQPSSPVVAALDDLLAAGLVSDDAGELRLTGAGRQLVLDLHATQGSAAADLWPQTLIGPLAPLVAAALDAARPTGGEAFALMAPDGPPDFLSPAGALAEQLTGLRFHRFDAHIAAWQHTGLTIGELESIADSTRTAIEEETNARASVAYEALSDEERLTLIAGLAALPG